MSLKPLLSFSSGELDPILTDNVTLEKFNKGLATARNVMIGKTGALLTRFSRKHVMVAKDTGGKPIKIYQPPNTRILLEFGHLYVRVHYNFDTFISGFSYEEVVTDITSDELDNLHFTTSGDFVYVFCANRNMKKLRYVTDGFSPIGFLADADVFKIPNPLNFMSVVVTSSTGYLVDYFCTVVVNGEETLGIDSVSFSPGGFFKPVAAGAKNTIVAKWPASALNFAEVSEVRVYSRPNKGGAYGLLGSTTQVDLVGANREATFIDIGGVPDYANGTQDIITKYGLGGVPVINLKPRTGTVYQQRLLFTTEADREAIVASRPGFKNNFYRDFPYASDSSLLFKAGTSGKAYVLRIVESEGLVVFTTNGVYTNSGLLGPTNIGLDKRGAWIINEKLPPLVIPGGLFFVDTSNTIRQMVFNQEILAYESVEQTIFSNHLFKRRKIKSWCYQTGTTPLILVTFSDGTFAKFTYNFEHQMKAWTRGDSKYPVEQVEGTIEYDTSIFVVNKNGQRQIEITLPRYISAEKLEEDTESDMKAPAMFADSIKERWEYAQAEEFLKTLTFQPVTPGDWSGQLKVTYPDQELPGASGPWTPYIGYVFRWFHPVTKYAIDLTVISSATLQTVFQPSEEFPSEYAAGQMFYFTRTSITGLDHLEGEQVAVLVDGAVLASPYNDKEEYDIVTVTGGTVTIDEPAAIIVVGRPICADIKTLNVSTVEQSPTLIESVNVNKMYVRVQDTRGLYVANTFPEESLDQKDGHTVEKMDSLDEALVPQEADLIGNRYFPPVSKRCEVTMRGEWSNNGQVSFRQVDPFHFEILSIIPDLTVLSRSDR